MNAEERQFHLRQFELAFDAAWKSQASIDRHVRFFFVTLFASVGFMGWAAKRGLAALATLLLLLLGLYVLDAVTKLALASAAFRRTVELLRTRLGDARLGDEANQLTYPLANDGARKLLITTDSLLVGALVWLSLSEVLVEVAGPWLPVVAGVIALQLAAGAWFVFGRVAKRHENAADSAAHGAIPGSTATSPWWTAPRQGAKDAQPPPSG